MKKEKIVALAKARHLEVSPSEMSVVRLVQRQDLNIDVRVEDNQPKSIGGAIRSLQWQNLDDLAELLRQALLRAGLHNAENLLVELSVACVAGKWSPVADIWLSTGAMTTEVREKTARVVELALTEVSMPAKGQHALFDVGLNPETVQAVKECVATTLATKGGSVLRAPISAYVAGQQVTNVAGRLRSKPDRSNFAAVPVECLGRLTGFETEREILFFRSVEQGSIEINFGKLDLDLVAFAQVIMRREDVGLRLHRTDNNKGHPQYAYGCLLQDHSN